MAASAEGGAGRSWERYGRRQAERSAALASLGLGGEDLLVRGHPPSADDPDAGGDESQAGQAEGTGRRLYMRWEACTP